MRTTDVLVAGAGPVGLTAAIELARRGIACRIVDPLSEPPLYAKAVGVQPRTLELFEGMGVLQHILDAAVPLRGQIVYVNGKRVSELALQLPAEVPFGFVAIPQYETERVLRDQLENLGVRVERGVRLSTFEQDADGVTATLGSDAGDQAHRCRWLIGADGARSVVRKTLGLRFEGGAFDEQYMLGDVEVDWSLPHGFGLRSMHQTQGKTDDVLVCIPLPGRGRYRMSMLVADELASAPADAIAHGFEGSRKPELRHIQAVLDRLSPQPVVARNLRWSSVFRISHRIVDAYGRGRVFVAGDAAHIHPPTGAQGMNTGIQDAHNLAWKLALAARGEAAAGLLDSYDAERRPVGEEVVGRTVRSAREGIEAGAKDPLLIAQREGQLLISYTGSPIVAGAPASAATAAGPQPGSRAPDARGLIRDAVATPLRLFSLLDRRDHTMLLYAGESVVGDTVARFEAVAATLRDAAHGRVHVVLIAAPQAEVAPTVLPLIRDAGGEFARLYATSASSAFIVRPDGYLGFTSLGEVSPAKLVGHLKATFR